MNGEIIDGGDGEVEGEEVVTLERKDEEEKEQMEVSQAREVLESQAEDEGVDEEIVEPAVGTDEDEGESAVPLEGQQTMSDEEEGDATMPVEGEQRRLTKAEKKAAKAARRGTKRKAGEVEADEVEDDEEDDTEAPPNPESDQPASKKKLKVNTDGTVDGYEDDVRCVLPLVLC
jgi:5'-3' exoribonuclease 2